MLKLLIIADDFTGALDTGVQFSKKNISTLVTSNINLSPNDIDDTTEVLVVDTESRHLPSEQAYSIVKNIVSKFVVLPSLFFYKKTDSTLRGNVGSELEGFMDGLAINEVSFIPALPSSSRTTRNGYHYVNNILLEESDFAKDPLNPTKDSYIPNIISLNTSLTATCITKEKRNDQFINIKKNVNIFDCETNDDLIIIGDILEKKNKLRFLSGCAGFANILSDKIKFNKKTYSYNLDSHKNLFVCGSVNRVSLEQSNFAKNNGYEYYTLMPNEELDNSFIHSEKYNDLVVTFSEKVEKNGHFLIGTLDKHEDLSKTLEYAKNHNIDTNNLGLKIAYNIGFLIKDIIDHSKVTNLIVFGGDTLIGILNKLQCVGIIPLDEISPGVVIAKTISSIKRYNIYIITKAGGFGDKNIVNTINDFLINKSLQNSK